MATLLPQSLPDRESVALDKDGWLAYCRAIKRLVREIEEDEKEKRLQEEIDQYRGETSDQRITRACQAKEWIFNKRLHPLKEDIRCFGDDRCYYQQDSCRVERCTGSYRFKGTRYYLCDACFDHHYCPYVESPYGSRWNTSMIGLTYVRLR